MRRDEGTQAGRPDGRHHRAVAAVLVVVAVLLPAAFAGAVTSPPVASKSGTAVSTERDTTGCAHCGRAARTTLTAVAR